MGRSSLPPRVFLLKLGSHYRSAHGDLLSLHFA